MAKKTAKTEARRGKLRELLKEYNAGTMADVRSFVRMLAFETIREALDAAKQRSVQCASIYKRGFRQEG